MSFSIEHVNPLSISLEQRKLLASAVRVKILQAVRETPRTVKQLSDFLGETPGNVHYHIQRLVEGKLLELVETRIVNGIAEKYYKSHATIFKIPESSRPGVETQLMLTAGDVEELKLELAELLERWERKTAFREKSDDVTEMLVNVDFIAIKEKTE